MRPQLFQMASAASSCSPRALHCVCVCVCVFSRARARVFVCLCLWLCVCLCALCVSPRVSAVCM